MKKLVVGILAHVDAGKTTLSEAILYTTGSIRSLGRVDRRDAFLDTDGLERERGITIFSKQAQLVWEGREIILLDTPGHVDFSAEMERTLQILDYCILVISGTDGVQSHVRTLWRLLDQYKVPVFLFINKMDRPGTDKGRLMKAVRNSAVKTGTGGPGSGRRCPFAMRDFWRSILRRGFWRKKAWRRPYGKGIFSPAISDLPYCFGALRSFWKGSVSMP